MVVVPASEQQGGLKNGCSRSRKPRGSTIGRSPTVSLMLHLIGPVKKEYTKSTHERANIKNLTNLYLRGGLELF
ncbi:hypothetical protein C8Q78DRAFT_1053751, partial [Trametes maxima]